MNDIIDSVMRSEPLVHTLTTIADLASEQLRFGGVSIAYEPGGGSFGGLVARGLDDALTALCGRSEAGRPWRDAMAAGQVVMRSGYDLEPDLRAVASAAGYRGCWSVPLLDPAGRSVGCVTIWTADDIPAAPAERDFLRKLCRTAVFAIDRWQRDKAMAYAASHDALTGLYNRSTFLDHVIDALAVASQGGAVAGNCLLAIDLDGFKEINDRHGHLAGDEILTEVSRRLRTAVRAGDIVARMGGDEFAVLCPALDSTDEATAVAGRIIQAVHQPFVIRGVAMGVGASVGIAFHDVSSGCPDGEPGPWVDGLFARADAALYAAKAAGKSRWELAVVA